MERWKSGAGFLRNVGNLTAKTLLGAVAHVLPVHQHAALLHVVQRAEELGERGLARAGAAHQANTLASGDVEVEVLEDVVILGRVRVAEAQVLEIDATLGDGKRLCVCVVCHERWLVEPRVISAASPRARLMRCIMELISLKRIVRLYV